MGGDVEAAGSRPEASHTAAIVGADLRYLSISNIRRSVETACASWIQRRGREMLGQVALCCASVGVFAVIGWQAMGIHETPSRAPHAPAKVTQAQDTDPVSDQRVLELTIIAGAGPIAVDLDQFYAPAARRVDAVALSPPASAGVAAPATARVAQDTTIIAAPAASPTSPLVAPLVVLDDPVDAPPPVVAVAPAPSIVEIAPDQVAAAAPLDDQELVVASASPGILAAVDQWRSVWEARDTAAYVDLYHLENPVARANASGRLIQFTKARLSARAQNVFDTYDRIQVSIGRLDVSHEGDLVVSTFDEDLVAWRADAGASPDYVGRGRKTLVYARDTDNAWRIVSEQWRPAQH
jgi:ketosteroid isomerase-like protein